MNKITFYILLIFFLGCFEYSKADEIYPFSYTKLEYHQGGELVIAIPSKNDTSVLTYFIKPNWTEESEVFYVWKGIPRNNAKGYAIGSAHILASYPLEKTVLMVWNENNRLFVANVDSNFTMISITEIYGNWSAFLTPEAEWAGNTSSNSYLLIINKNLFVCSIDKAGQVKSSPIASEVIRAIPVNSEDPKSNYLFAYMKSQEGNGIVYFVSKSSDEKFAARVPMPDEVYLYSFGSQVAVVMSSKSFPNSLVQIIDSERGVLSEFWIESPADRVRFKFDNKYRNVYYLKNNITGYSLVINDYNNLKKPANLTTTSIPKELIEPVGFWIGDDYVYVIFRNGIATLSLNGTLKSSDYFPFGEYFANQPKLYSVGNYLVIASTTSSMIFERKEHNFWILNRFLRNFGEILFPTILILVLFILYQMYRKKKRLLNAILNLPSSGVVLIIDHNGRLNSTNVSGKRLLSITDSVPMNKLFQFYCELEHTKPVLELVEKALATKDSIVQKINIVKNNDVNEWYCTIVPLFNFAGKFRGLVLTGVDITEELERKRLSNWAQLAHDMQTNLSTIRLNAEQFDIDGNTNNNERRRKIIHQVGLLIQRVRDVVTVGRSESVNKEIVDSFDICNEVRGEFDESVFPNTEFEVRAEHFNVSCDKPKMIRALRNAVENGIRSMGGKPGKITIYNNCDSRFAYFHVLDTGIGMDEKTKAKMLTPYFTTAKKSGGAGIGTMIMQHVMELHGGTISISSEKGKGSELIFTIPIYAHNKTAKAITQKLSPSN